jgi:complement component 1 Q subcomponent-binding protein
VIFVVLSKHKFVFNFCFTQPETEFKSFIVEERPGAQVVTMKGRFGDNEDIKIDATMFDGFANVPAFGDDSSGVNVQLHLSLIVDISKGEDGNGLEFVCSAWPDSLDVHKVFILKRGSTKSFDGPDFRFELCFFFLCVPIIYLLVGGD